MNDDGTYQGAKRYSMEMCNTVYVCVCVCAIR